MRVETHCPHLFKVRQACPCPLAPSDFFWGEGTCCMGTIVLQKLLFIGFQTESQDRGNRFPLNLKGPSWSCCFGFASRWNVLSGGSDTTGQIGVQ